MKDVLDKYKGRVRLVFQDFPLPNHKDAPKAAEAGGKTVGLSMFGGYSYNERSMLSLGVVDPEFRVFGWENLHVCDASVFPTSIGVNPQLTVMALAHYATSFIR